MCHTNFEFPGPGIAFIFSLKTKQVVKKTMNQRRKFKDIDDIRTNSKSDKVQGENCK